MANNFLGSALSFQSKQNAVVAAPELEAESGAAHVIAISTDKSHLAS